MVLRAVERGEVEPVVLDLRAVGDLETDRAPDFLDALPGADHRMDIAASAAAPRQRDVERLLGEAGAELRLGERRAPRLERRLDLLLGAVEGDARRAAFFGRPADESPSSPALPR